MKEIKIKLSDAQSEFLNDISKTDLLADMFDHGYGICAEERVIKYLLIRAIDDIVRSGWRKGLKT